MIYNEDIVDFLKDYQRRTREVLRRTEWLAGNAALMEEEDRRAEADVVYTLLYDHFTHGQGNHVVNLLGDWYGEGR